MSSLQTYQQFVSLLFRVADSRARFADIDAILDLVRNVVAKNDDLDVRISALSEEFSRLTTDHLLSREQEFREIAIPQQEPQPLTQVHIIELKAPASTPAELHVIKEPVLDTNTVIKHPPTLVISSVSDGAVVNKVTDAEETEADADADAEETEADAEETEADAEETEAEADAEETEADAEETEADAEETEADADAEETEADADAEETEADADAEETEADAEETEADAEETEEGEATETEEAAQQEEDEGEAVEEEEVVLEEEDVGEAEEEIPITYIYHELGKSKRKVLEHPETHELFDFAGENTPGAYLNCKYISGKLVKDE